jgi:uncharacterized membrane protein
MQISETSIHRLFRWILWLKLANSLLEIVAGVLLGILTNDAIVRFARMATASELIEDPHDHVANMLRAAVATFSTASQSFATWYLVSHGLLKLLMVMGVLANRTWAYPGFFVALIGFIIYQLYKLSHQVTFGMSAITGLDVVVLCLAWHEYRLIRVARS